MEGNYNRRETGRHSFQVKCQINSCIWPEKKFSRELTKEQGL
jgi:hypothetical protein